MIGYQLLHLLILLEKLFCRVKFSLINKAPLEQCAVKVIVMFYLIVSIKMLFFYNYGNGVANS